MAFPTSPVLDDFNTGASQALTARAGWFGSVRASGGMSTDVVPTYAKGVDGVVGGNIWNTIFAADQEVWATFKIAPTTGGLQIEGRFDAVPGNGYACIYNGGTMSIVRLDAFGGGPQVGSNFSVTPAIGDSMGMAMVGTTISGWFKTAAGSWTQVITGTEATYNAPGRIDMLTFGTPSAQIDVFGGGAVGSATGSGHGSLLLTGVG